MIAAGIVASQRRPPPTVRAMTGGGNLRTDDVGNYRTPTLTLLGAGHARMSLMPDAEVAGLWDDYFSGGVPSPANCDALVLELLNAGLEVHAFFEFESEWDSATLGVPERNYADWFAIGAAFAARFKPGSAFLATQGLTRGISNWQAVNEVDNPLAEDPALTYVQWKAMLHGLADGVHSEHPAARVWPGGFAIQASSVGAGAYTGHGYITAIADLLNDGTLAGIDLHPYWGQVGRHLTWPFSPQKIWDQVQLDSGLTRQSVRLMAAEFNFAGEPLATQQGYTEAYATRAFMTAFFAMLGVVRADGVVSRDAKMPWNIWRQGGSGNAQFFMAEIESPWIGMWSGLTYRRLLRLVGDMTVISSDPYGTGIVRLRDAANDRHAWFFPNDATEWSTLFGTSFTLTDIPASATRVRMYDGVGLIETRNDPGASEVFTTPTGRSYLFIAEPAPVAPSIVTTSASQHSGATSYSKSFTVAANANRKLLVGFGKDSTTMAFSNVQWGGVALTQVVSAAQDNLGASLWELVNPAAGTANITWDSVSSTAHVCVAIDVRDAVQAATAVGDKTSVAAATVAVSSLALSATVSDLLVDLLAGDSSSQTLTKAAGDGAQIANQVATSIMTVAASAHTAEGIGSVSLGWKSSSTQRLAHVMVKVRPVS